MRLTILGCSGSVPGPNAAASGYLLESEGFVLGLELGNGTLASLQAIRDPFDLDALVFSHLHPDHCADFSALTVLRRYHPAPPYDVRPRRLPVYGPAGAQERLTNAFAADAVERATANLTDVYEFHSLSAGAGRIGPFTITVSQVDHPTDAFGFRVSAGGRTLAYTGDTGPCAELTKLAIGTDALLCEASWTDSAQRPSGVHLSGRQAGQLASKAKVRRLLLTHIAPWCDRTAVLGEARAEFSGACELVRQGAVYRI